MKGVNKLKKLLKTILLLVLCIVYLLGCTSRAPLIEYKEAVRKTNAIKRGQMSYELSVMNEYNTYRLKEDQIKKLNYFKKIDISTYTTYDSVQDRVIARNYYNFGGMGFDSTLYIDKEKSFVKMPLVGKYLNLANGKEDKNSGDFELVVEEIMESINSKWLKILEEDDVITGEKTVLNVKDGEVKVTRFSVRLTEKQIKSLLNDILDVISANENLFNEFGWDSTDIPIEFEKVVLEFKEKLKNVRVKEFRYDAYIDIDGYIIQENGKLVLEFKSPRPGEAKVSEYSFTIKNWSIEKPQKFDYPVINKENILNREDINQSIPFMFEEMFEKSGREDN
jgi:hypothetical protein